MKLSAEVSTVGSEAEVSIYADREGLDYLLAQLGHLKRTDHVHLFSPAWGGSDLTEETHVGGTIPVRHFKIMNVP